MGDDRDRQGTSRRTRVTRRVAAPRVIASVAGPRTTRPRAALAAFAALATSAGLAACYPATDATPASPSPEGDLVNLTVMTITDIGIGPLLEQYEAEHPGVTVTQRFETPGSEHLLDEIEAGHPLSDVMVLEGRLGALMGESSVFADLRDFGADARRADYLDWTWAGGTDAAGRVVGYGLDIAPMALCFRSDLLRDAGIASDREELAAVLSADGGGWDVFFDVGRRYRQATGRAWFDRGGVLWDAMVSQQDNGYTALDGEPLPEDPDLRARWDLLAAAIADGLSADQVAWDWNGGESLIDGTFAVTVCPPWFLPVVEGAATAAGGGPETGWDVADVFPGGGATWGGTYMAVSADSRHPAEAAALVEWLTQPAQQLVITDSTGTYPASRDAIAERAAAAEPHPFFHDAPVDATFASRALTVPTHAEGPYDWRIALEVFAPAVDALETGADAQATWEHAMSEVAAGAYR